MQRASHFSVHVIFNPRSVLVLIGVASLTFGARAEVTPGEVLISEMNCTACHEATGLEARLASRKAPKLGLDGISVTPQWLRSFLADPQQAKPGTLMPDVMHGLPAEQKAEAVEALTHFLISKQAQRPKIDAHNDVSPTVLAEGERLFHSIGCVQCHAPTRLPEGREADPAATAELEQLASTSVPLDPAIASKYSLAELARFLRDPLGSRPSGRMPNFNLNADEAATIAMFLLREQIPASKVEATQGLRYKFYDQEFTEIPQFERLKPTQTGVVPRPTLAVARTTPSYALRFEGDITIPRDGLFKFFTESDDGSRLYIDNRLVVENGGLHAAQERGGEIELKSGKHLFALEYMQSQYESVLRVRWQGPELERQEIPATAFSVYNQPLVPLKTDSFALDPEKVARGRQLFTDLNCAACHQMDSPGRVAQALSRLTARQPRGCLSAKPPATAPKFEISDRQRQVILALLQEQTPLKVPLSAEEQIRRTMTVLNCYACHSRDRRGGSSGMRRDYLTSAGSVDLGEEGRIPPSLQGVGFKLQVAWLRNIMRNGTKIRPYMATRMPRYSNELIGTLPELFQKADLPADTPQAMQTIAAPGSETTRYGRTLVGTSGLSCIACHSLDGHRSLGAPALDLARISQRLNWPWFRQYLVDPQKLRPGTRMPSFWPDGVASNQSVLEGNTDKQISAIWSYLAQPQFPDLPAGLQKGKQEIAPTTEAVIYRNFIEGGGPRAIGVGYPEKSNLCFDANEVRYALFWHGPFIDAALHRTARGEGFVKPLGVNVIKGTPGPPFAILPSESTRWPNTTGKNGGYQFLGYQLDDKRRPTFLYRFNDIEIADFPKAVPGPLEASFHRTITLKTASSPANLYHRVATVRDIQKLDDGTFMINKEVRVRFPKSAPLIRTSDGMQELLIPIQFKDGVAIFEEEIIW